MGVSLPPICGDTLAEEKAKRTPAEQEAIDAFAAELANWVYTKDLKVIGLQVHMREELIAAQAMPAPEPSPDTIADVVAWLDSQQSLLSPYGKTVMAERIAKRFIPVLPAPVEVGTKFAYRGDVDDPDEVVEIRPAIAVTSAGSREYAVDGFGDYHGHLPDDKKGDELPALRTYRVKKGKVGHFGRETEVSAVFNDGSPEADKVCWDVLAKENCINRDLVAAGYWLVTNDDEQVEKLTEDEFNATYELPPRKQGEAKPDREFACPCGGTYILGYRELDDNSPLRCHSCDAPMPEGE